MDPRIYALAAKALPSVEDWRDSRVSGLLGSLARPPYQYVVTLETKDPEQLRRDMANEEMKRLFSELHELAEITQLVSERLARELDLISDPHLPSRCRRAPSSSG